MLTDQLQTGFSTAIFQPDRWRQADFTQRLEALQQLEHQMALTQGRDERQVKPRVYQDDSVMGSFSGRRPDQIDINARLLYPEFDESMSSSNFVAADTIIHEGRHAYQNDVIDGSITNEDSQFKDIWQQNQLEGVYFDPEKGAPDEKYFYQPIERDASGFAAEQSDRLFRDMGADYEEYRQNRDEYMKMQAEVLTRKYGADNLEDAVGRLDQEVGERYEAVQTADQGEAADIDQERDKNQGQDRDEDQDRRHGQGYGW